MSNHKTPLTEIEREGLIAHGLGRYIGKPSQLMTTMTKESDALAAFLSACIDGGMSGGKTMRRSYPCTEGAAMTTILLTILAVFVAVAVFQFGMGVMFAAIELAADVWIQLEDLCSK